MRATTLASLIFSSLTFLGVLIGNIYIPLIGRGKFRPWGYINRFTGYYPIENIKQSGKADHSSLNNIESGLLKQSNGPNGPGIEEILEIYLDRVEKAKYS